MSSDRRGVAEAVRSALERMGARARVEYPPRAHPRVHWTDGELRGTVFVPGTAGEHRSRLNNIRMAERLLRQARRQREEGRA